jgi:hydrogenase maturation protease
MNPLNDAWEVLRASPPASVLVHGVPVGVGQRVRLRPRAGGDVMDLALADRTAVVEGIDLTIDGEPHFTVTLDDDPGRDLGVGRYPGHRFFFRADELLVLDAPAGAAPNATRTPRILVAGIGNIFFGDDGFGVAVAMRMANTRLAGVTVRDFGIRGMDLVFALHDGYDAAILVDAMPRGGEPGTVYVIVPDADASAAGAAAFNAHGLDPVRVLQLARSLGSVPERIVVVGCEPETVTPGESPGDALVTLSAPVEAAVGEAVQVVDKLIARLTTSINRPQGEAECP